MRVRCHGRRGSSALSARPCFHGKPERKSGASGTSARAPALVPRCEVSDIKCLCSHCNAKYRLPAEFAGRTARCKKCGEKFDVPKGEKSLEDSVLDWLSDADETEEVIEQPRVINIPKDAAAAEGSRKKGVIRMKGGGSDVPDAH
jgi:hypothetical protein